MAYCDIDDVRTLNPTRTYSSSTSPTDTQVESLIDQIDNEIDSTLLGRGITVPITTPADFLGQLKLLNAQGAGALAEMAMFPEAAGTPGGSPHGQRLWAMYQKGIKWLQTGQLPAAIDGEVQPSSFFEQHPITEPTEEYTWRKPKFGKDKEF